MADVRFEWDPRKSRTNKAKHGVSFEEARTAFLDEHARVIPDPQHSDDEDRFVLLGLSVSCSFSSCAIVTAKPIR